MLAMRRRAPEAKNVAARSTRIAIRQARDQWDVFLVRTTTYLEGIRREASVVTH